VAVQCKAVRAGEAGRAGADHRDTLAGGFAALEWGGLVVHQPVGRAALQRADPHRPLLLRRAHAGGLAQDLGGTNTGATAAENVLLQDLHRRATQVAGGDAANEAGNVDSGRTGFQARRVVAEVAAAGLDHRLVGGQRRVRVGEVGGDLGGREPPGGDIDDLGHGAASPVRCVPRPS
jgi:hypothetical protein